MPDQVRYIVYKVITAACNRPELGWPGTEPKISNQMIRHVVVHLNIDGTNSAKKDFDVFPHYLNRWKKNQSVLIQYLSVTSILF